MATGPIRQDFARRWHSLVTMHSDAERGSAFVVLLLLVAFLEVLEVSQVWAQSPAQYWVNQGIAEVNHGHLDDAILNYDKAIGIDSRFTNAFFFRGNARYSKGDYDGAIADFTRAVELVPNFMDAYLNRGNARLLKGDLFGSMAESVADRASS